MQLTAEQRQVFDHDGDLIPEVFSPAECADALSGKLEPESLRLRTARIQNAQAFAICLNRLF